MIQAVVPTTSGREHFVNACVESLEAHGIEPIVVTESPSCGAGWEFGLEKCNAKVVGLWSDDLTIHTWNEQRVLQRIQMNAGSLICPVIRNPDLSLQGAGGFGLNLKDGETATNCIAPIAERQVLEGFLPWPHLNHYCDTWITQRAIWAQRGPIVTKDVSLIHHHLSDWDSAEYVAWQAWLGRPDGPVEHGEHTGGLG